MTASVNQRGEELTDKDLYEQGSKCCQQYSELTMQIRTLAQYIMIAYTVGISLTLVRSDSPRQNSWYVLVGAGVVVSLFASVLGFLNYHYASAFRKIRDLSLIRLEKKALLRATEPLSTDDKPYGPWQAHQLVREKQRKLLFWHGPFIVLGMLGLAGIVTGILLR